MNHYSTIYFVLTIQFKTIQSIKCLGLNSVSDPCHFDLDPDPDPR